MKIKSPLKIIRPAPTTQPSDQLEDSPSTNREMKTARQEYNSGTVSLNETPNKASLLGNFASLSKEQTPKYKGKFGTYSFVDQSQIPNFHKNLMQKLKNESFSSKSSNQSEILRHNGSSTQRNQEPIGKNEDSKMIPQKGRISSSAAQSPSHTKRNREEETKELNGPVNLQIKTLRKKISESLKNLETLRTQVEKTEENEESPRESLRTAFKNDIEKNTICVYEGMKVPKETEFARGLKTEKTQKYQKLGNIVNGYLLKYADYKYNDGKDSDKSDISTDKTKESCAEEAQKENGRKPPPFGTNFLEKKEMPKTKRLEDFFNKGKPKENKAYLKPNALHLNEKHEQNGKETIHKETKQTSDSNQKAFQEPEENKLKSRRGTIGQNKTQNSSHLQLKEEKTSRSSLENSQSRLNAKHTRKTSNEGLELPKPNTTLNHPKEKLIEEKLTIGNMGHHKGAQNHAENHKNNSKGKSMKPKVMEDTPRPVEQVSIEPLVIKRDIGKFLKITERYKMAPGTKNKTANEPVTIPQEPKTTQKAQENQPNRKEKQEAELESSFSKEKSRTDAVYMNFKKKLDIDKQKECLKGPRDSKGKLKEEKETVKEGSGNEKETKRKVYEQNGEAEEPAKGRKGESGNGPKGGVFSADLKETKEMVDREDSVEEEMIFCPNEIIDGNEKDLFSCLVTQVSETQQENILPFNKGSRGSGPSSITFSELEKGFIEEEKKQREARSSIGFYEFVFNLWRLKKAKDRSPFEDGMESFGRTFNQIMQGLKFVKNLVRTPSQRVIESKKIFLEKKLKLASKAIGFT